MGRRRSGMLMIVIGVVLALIAALATGFLVLSSASAPRQVEVPKQPVVVAKRDIPANTLVDPGMVEVKDFPINIVPQGAVAKLEDVTDPNDVSKRKYTTTTIFAGQALLSVKLADTKGAEGVAYRLKPAEV